MADTDTIHVCLGGHPLCKFTDKKASEWPNGHLFVHIDDFDQSNCNPCRERAQEHMKMSV